MDRLLCLVATRPVVPEPCNGSNRRSILLAFHTDKRKRASVTWMHFVVDSDSESQLEVIFFEFLGFSIFKPVFRIVIIKVLNRTYDLIVQS